MSTVSQFRYQSFWGIILTRLLLAQPLDAQPHQWVALNGVLSDGVSQIIPIQKNVYFCGYIPVSYSPSEGWKKLSGAWGEGNILVAPDGRMFASGNAISFDSIQPKPVHYAPGYNWNFAIDSSGGLYAVGSNGIGYSRNWYTGWTFTDTFFASIPELQTTMSGELVALGKEGISVSTDSGHTWRQSHDTTNSFTPVHSLDVSNPNVWYANFYLPHAQVSRDRGRTWKVDTACPIGLSLIRWRTGSEGYASASGGIYVTKDGGKTWQQVPGVPPSKAIGLTSDTIYLFSNGTLFFKAYADQKWQTESTLPSAGGTVTSIFEDPLTGTLLASVNNGGLDQGSATLYRSANNGTWWSQLMTVNLRFRPIGNPKLTGTSHGIYYYGYGGVPLRSSDDGITWHRTIGWIGDTDIVSITELPSGELYGVNGAAIYRSSDGILWGLTYNMEDVVTIGSDPSGRLYAGTSQTLFLAPGTVFRSTNGGSQWQKLLVDVTNPQSIRCDDRNVYVADLNGHYHSTDHGDTWTFSDSGGTRNVSDAIPIGRDSYAIISDSHLLLFPKGADSVAENTPSLSCMFSDPQSHIMYVGGGSGVERSTTPIFYAPLSVNRSATASPVNDEVSTDGRSIRIRYELDAAEDFRLTLMDVLGRSISQTRLGVQSQGVHEYVLGTQTVAQGAYFLVITKGGNSSIHHVAILE